MELVTANEHLVLVEDLVVEPTGSTLFLRPPPERYANRRTPTRLRLPSLCPDRLRLAQGLKFPFTTSQASRVCVVIGLTHVRLILNQVSYSYTRHGQLLSEYAPVAA